MLKLICKFSHIFASRKTSVEMSKIKAVLLDFDGTLANTTDIIVQTMYATIRELNLPERT